MRKTPGCVHGQDSNDSHLRLAKNPPKARCHSDAGRWLSRVPLAESSSKVQAPTTLGSHVPAHNFVSRRTVQPRGTAPRGHPRAIYRSSAFRWLWLARSFRGSSASRKGVR